MNITFNVSGYVSQTIEPINGESVVSIVKKLNSGEYVTTLHGGKPFITRSDMNGRPIAEIIGVNNQLEYFDFEVEE